MNEKQVANILVQQLKGMGFIVHRYNSERLQLNKREFLDLRCNQQLQYRQCGFQKI